LPRINVYSPEGCKPYLTRTDDGCGWYLDYEGQRDYMTPGEPYRATEAASIIADLHKRFPLNWLMNIEVFCAPGELRVYEPARIYPWGDASYNGIAYASHIVIGAKRNANLVMTITHEIGHSLTYLFVDPVYADKIHSPAMLQYLALRGLDPQEFGYGGNWNKRGWEEFAQTFAGFFGDEPTRREVALWYQREGIPAPSNEVEVWMRNLISHLDLSEPLEVYVIGERETVARRNAVRVAPNFMLYEFESPDTGEVILDPSLLQKLQTLRMKLNVPVIVTSGYRTPEHNYKVGGSSDSYHMKGMAADIVVHGVPLTEVFRLAEECKFGGIHSYPEGFTHVDTGPVRRW
jgi:hypothetical protein